MPSQPQKLPGELRDILLQEVQFRAENQFAWKSVISQFMALPALRAFWPMSGVRYTAANQAVDVSNGNDLTNVNTVLFGYDTANALIPLARFDGATNYLERADGGAANWADITGTEAYIIPQDVGLTVGGWVKFDVNAGAAFETCASKYLAAGNQRAYYIIRRTAAAGGQFQFFVSGTGIAGVTVNSANAITAASGWNFVVGVFYPGTSIVIYVNKETPVTNAVAIPAAVFDSTESFKLGAIGGPANYLDGDESMWFLCACALSGSTIRQLYEQSRVMYNRV